MENKAAGDPMA